MKEWTSPPMERVPCVGPGVGPRALRVLVALATLLVAAPAARGADAQGDYAVRGAGALTCARFAEVATGNTRELPVILAWMDGHITAANRLGSETFDLIPFSTPGPFAAVVLHICRRNPALLLDGAVRTALQQLERLKVSRNSPFVEMTVGNNRVSLRQETLIAVQRKLSELNLYRGEADGRFGAQTRAALKSFQQSRQLRVTELPDPDTVVALLLRD